MMNTISCSFYRVLLPIKARMFLLKRHYLCLKIKVKTLISLLFEMHQISQSENLSDPYKVTKLQFCCGTFELRATLQ